MRASSFRREAIAVALVVSAACSSKPAPTKPPAPDSGAARDACVYGAGDLPSKTLGDYGTLGSNIPIDHIVLVMQENRSFDHYFSLLTVPGQTVDAASPTATNPDVLHPGQTVSRFHQTLGCFENPAEGWDSIHLDLDDGGLDGFTAQNANAADPQGLRALGYYDSADLPFYYSLAGAFSISDRHFSSALTNTWPNRLFYMAGTSYGLTGDGIFAPAADDAGVPYANVFTELDDAQVDWRFYAQAPVPTAVILQSTWEANPTHFLSLDRFFADADAGMLPAVAWVENTDFTGGVRPDEDPPTDPQFGEAAVENIVRAVMASPNWASTALFITWDEPGGFYDHVVPPAACIPDDLPPYVADGGFVAQFNQMGIRVGLLAVSPYAKRGYVSHQVTDHTAILRFVEARFNLPALTHRDANAVPPFDMFDFSAPNLTPPTLATSTLDPSWAQTCAAQYPP